MIRRHATPLTVLGGFLGAGKTTALNTLLRDPHFDGEGVWVMVNDFGSVNVDAEILAQHGHPVLSLANGCVCCTVGDDFMQTLHEVATGEAPPKRVLLEASGVGEPHKIAQAAWACGYAPEPTVVIASAREIDAHLADRYVADTVLRQLHRADIVLLNASVDTPMPEAAMLVNAPRFDARIDSIAPLLLEKASTAPFEARPLRAIADTTPFVNAHVRPSVTLSPEQLRERLAQTQSHWLRAKGIVCTTAGPMLVNATRLNITLEPAPSKEATGLLLIAHKDQGLALAQSALSLP